MLRLTFVLLAAALAAAAASANDSVCMP